MSESASNQYSSSEQVITIKPRDQESMRQQFRIVVLREDAGAWYGFALSGPVRSNTDRASQFPKYAWREVAEPLAQAEYLGQVQS